MLTLALAAAALSGALMAVQGTLNAGLGKVLGLLEAAFVVHVVGAVFGGGCSWQDLGRKASTRL